MKVFRIIMTKSIPGRARRQVVEKVSLSNTEFPPFGEVRTGFEDKNLVSAVFEYGDGTRVRYQLEK